jgi:transketolase
LNEGSTWESAALAGQLKLKNLVVFLDLNGQQALGKTKDILPTSIAVGSWEKFGWYISRVNGHSTAELQHCLDTHKSLGEGPLLIVASTIAGKGVNFMEGEIKWHYMPMSDNEFSDAISQVNMRLEKLLLDTESA